MAVGLYGLGTVLAPTFGPILAGLAIDNISWPSALPTSPVLSPGAPHVPDLYADEKTRKNLPPFD